MRAATLWFALCHAAWCGSTSASGANLTLAWDPSPDTNVVGYYAYWGNESGQYTEFAFAGHTTTFTVSNLTGGLVYFFVVTAVDADGLESEPSNQISYTVPNGIRVAIQREPDDQVLIRVPGMRGRLMRLEASENLVIWETIWEGTPDRDDWLNFGESHANSRMRFYRVVFP